MERAAGQLGGVSFETWRACAQYSCSGAYPRACWNPGRTRREIHSTGVQTRISVPSQAVVRVVSIATSAQAAHQLKRGHTRRRVAPADCMAGLEAGRKLADGHGRLDCVATNPRLQP